MVPVPDIRVGDVLLTVTETSWLRRFRVDEIEPRSDGVVLKHKNQRAGWASTFYHHQESVRVLNRGK